MAEKEQLSLTEYSRKYRVSISTLRRRIKTSQVTYQLDDGKYFLLDSPLDEQKDFLNQRATPMSLAPPQSNLGHRSSSFEVEPLNAEGTVALTEEDNEGVFSTAKDILAELKKAYALILQEKEEQIILLKEEVIDLRTLCRVLEDQNKAFVVAEKETIPPITDWLDSLDGIK